MEELKHFGLKLTTSPAFWEAFAREAAQATEKASPDYTVAHKIAAAVDHLITGRTISTPDAAHAQSVINAISEGVRALVATSVKVATAH